MENLLPRHPRDTTFSGINSRPSPLLLTHLITLCPAIYFHRPLILTRRGGKEGGSSRFAGKLEKGGGPISTRVQARMVIFE